MAILSNDDIISLIKKPLAASDLEAAIALQNRHKLHISGEGFDDLLNERIAGLESNSYAGIKKSQAKCTTPRIFSQILNQYRKAFRAQGFSRVYMFDKNSEDLNKDFRNYLTDIGGGLSLREMMQSVWFKNMFEDFNGVFTVELPSEESEVAEPFIKFFPTEFIHDISVNGKNVEYLILSRKINIKVGNRMELVTEYRVIDDVRDVKLIQGRGGDIEFAKAVDSDGNNIIDEIPNPWGYVPAIQTSTLRKSVNSDILKASPIWEVIPEADHYLSVSNAHVVSVKLHQYPIFYSLPSVCSTCNGEERIVVRDKSGIETSHTCTACNGAGLAPMHQKGDVSEGILLPEPEEGQSFEAKAPCGYVTPDIASLKDQRDELLFIELNIEKGALGTEGVLSNKTKRETATGKEIDFQPLLDELDTFSTAAEEVERFLTDAIGYIRYRDEYVGSNIHYGRRYFVRGIVSLEQEYLEAKAKGLPSTILKSILEEIIFTRFENNPEDQLRHLMLIGITPQPTLSIELEADYLRLVDMMQRGVMTKDEWVVKLNFNDLIERFEIEFGPITKYKRDLSKGQRVTLIKQELLKMAQEAIIVEPNNNNNEQG